MSDAKKLFKRLNERPVAFYRVYAKVMGNVSGGVYLSQLMHWYASMEGEEFYKKDDELISETCLSIREFREAKKRLKEFDFIEIKLKGSPPITHYKVDFEKLAAVIINLNDVVQIDSNNGVQIDSNDVVQNLLYNKEYSKEYSKEGEAHPPAVEIQNSNGASNGKAGEINLSLLANPENYPEPQIEHEAAKLAEKFVWEVFSPAWQKKMGQPYVPEYGGKGEIALLHLYKICIKNKTPALVRFRAENFFSSNKAYFFDRSYSLQFFCSVFNELDKPKFDRPKQNAPHANDPRYMRS